MTAKKFKNEISFNNTRFHVFMVLCIIHILFLPESFSQNINNNITADTVKQNIHSPKKATWMSVALPGLGQAYNKKYWKIPVIWAGFGGLGYAIAFNHDKYITYRDAYLYRIDNDSTTIDNFPDFSTNYLQTLKNSYRRNLEISIIITAALYTLNIIDAAVDAYLYDFDINDNISLKFKPSLIYSNNNSNLKISPGLTFTFNL